MHGQWRSDRLPVLVRVLPKDLDLVGHKQQPLPVQSCLLLERRADNVFDYRIRQFNRVEALQEHTTGHQRSSHSSSCPAPALVRRTSNDE